MEQLCFSTLLVTTALFIQHPELNATQSLKDIFCCNVVKVPGYCSQRWGLTPWLVWVNPGCSLTAPVINDDRLRSCSFITRQGFNLSIILNQCNKAKRVELGKWYLAIKPLSLVIKLWTYSQNCLWVTDSRQLPRNRFLCFHCVLSPTLSLHPSSYYVGFSSGPKIRRTQMSAVLYWCF